VARHDLRHVVLGVSSSVLCEQVCHGSHALRREVVKPNCERLLLHGSGNGVRNNATIVRIRTPSMTCTVVPVTSPSSMSTDAVSSACYSRPKL
jgi:hypothetical protein